MARRIFSTMDFVAIAVWWLASFAAAHLVADNGLSLVLRIGVSLALWATALGVPIWIVRRHKRLDEMQQMILWRTLAMGGLFIISYLVAMAAYFTLTSGDGNLSRGLLTMAAMAAPMTLMVSAALAAMSERAAEIDAEELEA